MCAVSVIMDYGRQHVPMQDWTQTKWDSFKDLLEEAKRFDEKTDQPNCEDPEKVKYLEAVEEFIKRIAN